VSDAPLQIARRSQLRDQHPRSLTIPSSDVCLLHRVSLVVARRDAMHDDLNERRWE